MIRQPSDLKHSAHLSDLNRLLDDHKALLREHDELTGGHWGQKKREKNKEATEKSIRDGQAFDREFGRIFASSGLRVAASGCSLDWGLVAVNDRITGSNKVSLPAKQLRFKYILKYLPFAAAFKGN